jgi:alkanesulfonate monooxygenase SsuD/methylene tetrahydromethanopterin reductase-like flavin-dependent oxidoreductase (luciferase family)
MPTMSEPTKKQLIINAFAMHSPSHLNPGLFRYPTDQGSSYKNIQTWITLAQKLEAAKFHAIFFADVLGGYDVYKGPSNLSPTIPAAAQFPINDPLYSIPAMAAATESIGFGVTASTTYDAPYALARRFSTVDHLSNGRVGWNIVTSYLDSAARNFGLDTQVEHDERYRIADEYLDVTYKLWEGSWRDDAVVWNQGVNGTEVNGSDAGGSKKERSTQYADPTRVRQIDHKGKYFQVPGPHLCEPSPQRTPFLLQAGTSTAGKAFAAKHAEAVFLHAQKPELVRPSVDSIRQQAAALGRNPADIKVIAGALVIVAETDEAAHAKVEELKKYGDREGALALFGGWTGYDLSTYADDQDFRFVELPAVRSMVNHWASTVPGTEGVKWDKRTIADYLVLGGNGVKIIGSVKTVADELERWVSVGDVDGFNLSYASLPDTFDDIIELLLPELRRRGLFWEDYAVKGGTLRENMYGQRGQSRLPEAHTGAKYFWKAGQDVPPYSLNESE